MISSKFKKILSKDAQYLIKNHTEIIDDTPTNMYPTISVSIITYNHEKFIVKAVESVFSQNTKYSYELVIGEDCSTDSTREILLKYQRKYPDRIRLLLSKQNLGQHTGNGRLNFIRNLLACRGKYIAILDGDDYWITDNKLDIQTTFMEENSDYIMTCHNALIIFDNNLEKSKCIDVDFDRQLNLKNFLKGTPAESSSYMFRHTKVDLFSDLMLNLCAGDWALYLLHASLGKTYYMAECMSVWRKHPGGICSSQSRSDNYWGKLVSYSLIRTYFDKTYHEYIEKCAVDIYLKYIDSIKKESSEENYYNLTKETIKNNSKILPGWLTLATKKRFAEDVFKIHSHGIRSQQADWKILFFLLRWTKFSLLPKYILYLILYYTKIYQLIHHDIKTLTNKD